MPAQDALDLRFKASFVWEARHTRKTDVHYMSLALELAQRGCGWTSPNPMVGAVLVKDGEIIGQGWHRRCGELHAEREALAACTRSPAGSTLYVTLEPCCHQGRQPPCTDAILEAGIARVVVGSTDPNPLVAGRGLAILRAHGVQVDTGVCGEACDALNRVFFHYIRTGRPYVVLKYAMTLDGKTATRTGASKWITGEEARRQVHRDRHRYSAILAGIGTVLADDPLLTCRLEGGRNPLRVICDSALRLPLRSSLVKTAREVPTVVAAAQADPSRRAALEGAGCRVWELPDPDGKVDLPGLLDRLGKEEIDSLLVEGGAAVAGAFLSAGLVQKVQAYIAPKLFGGAAAPSPVGGLGVALPEEALRLGGLTVTRLGDDILLEGEVEAHVHGSD